MATKQARPSDGSGVVVPIGGRGGIRTHERLAPLPVFKTGAFDHSATLPRLDMLPAGFGPKSAWIAEKQADFLSSYRLCANNRSFYALTPRETS